MKLKLVADLLLGSSTILILTACPGKKSPAPPASEPELECFWSWEFEDYIDDRGRSCRPDEDFEIFSNQYCFNFGYDVQTREWFDDFGRPVRCRQGYIDMDRFKPYTIRVGRQIQNSCDYWGNNYRPILWERRYICARIDIGDFDDGRDYQVCHRNSSCGQICAGAFLNFFGLFGDLGYCLRL